MDYLGVMIACDTGASAQGHTNINQALYQLADLLLLVTQQEPHLAAWTKLLPDARLLLSALASQCSLHSMQ